MVMTVHSFAVVVCIQYVTSKQASLFAQLGLPNKDIISMNNIQGQAARTTSGLEENSSAILDLYFRSNITVIMDARSA